jgi:hypothetical protein
MRVAKVAERVMQGDEQQMVLGNRQPQRLERRARSRARHDGSVVDRVGHDLVEPVVELDEVARPTKGELELPLAEQPLTETSTGGALGASASGRQSDTSRLEALDRHQHVDVAHVALPRCVDVLGSKGRTLHEHAVQIGIAQSVVDDAQRTLTKKKTGVRLERRSGAIRARHCGGNDLNLHQ